MAGSIGMGQHLANAFTSGAGQTQGALGGSVISGVAAGFTMGSNLGKTIASLLTNPLTAIPAAAAATIGAFSGLAVATKNLAESFAEFSPSLTGIFAMAEVRQIMRSQRVGEAIAPHVGPMVDALEDLKDAFEPLLIDIIKSAANLSTVFLSMVMELKPFIAVFWENVNFYVVTPIQAILEAIYLWITGNPWPGKNENEKKDMHLGPGWGIIDPKRPAAFRPQGP